MKDALDLSLVLACYREEEHFNSSFQEIYETLAVTRLKYEIILVEDHSPDNTAKLVARAVRKYPFVKAIYHKVNTGRGRTVADGIRVAKGRCAGYIDIDLEVSPVYIPRLVSIILDDRADVVIGKRIFRSSLWSLPREVFSLGYKWISNLMVGTGKLDTETGYKFFNRKKILPVLEYATHPHWFWDTQIMVFAKRSGLTIVEEPVLFLRRTDKQSTVRVVRDILDYLVSLFRFRQQLKQANIQSWAQISDPVRPK